MPYPRAPSSNSLIVRDAPIVFRRKLPTGRADACLTGLNVEVRIRSDLSVAVLGIVDAAFGLTGHYAFDRVFWDQAPCEDFPASAQAMLADDVASALHIFKLRLIDPRAWTSHPQALARL